MKKLMLIMFLVFFISSVSAAEFDNSKDYNEETRTATITNLFGFGDVIAKITLGSPLDFKVTAGEEVLVAWYELENIEDYAGLEVFDVVETLDLKRGNSEIQKNIVFKQKNGEEWTIIDKNNLLKSGNYTIGLFTEVEKGESVEWIPTMYGIEIPEWASWTESLQAGIQSYWKLDETTGTTANDSLGLRNITVNDAWTTGLINNADLFDAQAPSDTGYNTLGTDAFSINFWIKNDGSNPTGYIGGTNDSGSSSNASFFIQAAAQITIPIFGGTSATATATSSVSNTEFQMITFIMESGNQKIYVNGTEEDSETVAFANFANLNFTFFDFKVGGGQTLSNSIIDEVGIWNRILTQQDISDLYNEGAGITITDLEPLAIVSLNSPPDSHVFNNFVVNSFNYYASNFSSSVSNLTNVTLNIWDGSGTLVETNFTTLTGAINFTNLSIGGLDSGTYLWNYEACSTNTTSSNCSVGDSNRTVEIQNFRENNYNFENFTIETKTESFNQNVTLQSGASVSSTKLFYNGTGYTATSTASGDDFILSKTDLDIPLIGSEQNRTFFWSVTLSNGVNVNLTIYNQTTQTLNFTHCGPAPLAVPFINLTFKNETVSLEDVNASITSSTWSYYLGSGTINKTLTFSNATENTEYTFCGSPASETINIISSVNYVNSESQQRTYSLTSVLSNVTLSQVLYLLPTSAGLFSPFRAEDTVGTSLQDVLGTITRVIDGSSVTITSGFTDSSGFITYFLNPDFTYSGLFTKSGFPDNSFSFVPSADLRTVTMGSSTTAPNGTVISLETNYTILPTNTSLQNNTIHTFSFEVSSGQTITLISLNITNTSGDQVLFQSNAGVGIISGTYNPENDTRIFGEFIIQTGTETTKYSRLWLVGPTYAGDYSIFRQLTFFTQYGFSDFWRILIILFSIMGIIIFMSSQDLVDTSESKVIVGVLMIWFFSIVGWLDNPAIVSTTGLSVYAKQYGLAILSSFAGFFFIARRLFIRRI